MAHKKKADITKLAEELAVLKLEKKQIEENIKETEKKLQKAGVEQYETEHGKLLRAEQTIYKIPDNFALIEKSNLTRKDFIGLAKISGSVLKKAIGEKAFASLVENKIVFMSKSNGFYKLVK